MGRYVDYKGFSDSLLPDRFPFGHVIFQCLIE